MDGNGDKAAAAEEAETGSSPAVESFDIARIMGAIPHRYPFLLVDRIVDVVPGTSAVGGFTASGLPAAWADMVRIWANTCSICPTLMLLLSPLFVCLPNGCQSEFIQKLDKCLLSQGEGLDEGRLDQFVLSWLLSLTPAHSLRERGF